MLGPPALIEKIVSSLVQSPVFVKFSFVKFNCKLFVDRRCESLFDGL